MNIDEIEKKYGIVDIKLKTIASIVHMIHEIKAIDFSIRFDLCTKLWDECDRILKEAYPNNV